MFDERDEWENDANNGFLSYQKMMYEVNKRQVKEVEVFNDSKVDRKNGNEVKKAK